MEALMRWQWPGNVRELGNLLERAVILTRGPNLHVPLSEVTVSTADSPVPSTLEASTRDAIVRALRKTGGIIGGPRGAAMRLGLKRTTLTAKMQRLGISRKQL
jgi:formate hydrogenlyase transcriptional activator